MDITNFNDGYHKFETMKGSILKGKNLLLREQSLF